MGNSAEIQIVGDSWAQFIWMLPDQYNNAMLSQMMKTYLKGGWDAVMQMPGNSPFQSALQELGMSPDLVDGNVTAVGGTTADFWAQSNNLRTIQDTLRKNENVKAVHLSIGGNDFLFALLPSILPPDLNSLAQKTIENIKIIAEGILAVRSDIHILHVGYTYLNLSYPVFQHTKKNVTLFNMLFQAYMMEIGKAAQSFANMTFMDNFSMLPDPPSPDEFVDHAFHLSFGNYTTLAKKCITEYYTSWLG